MGVGPYYSPISDEDGDETLVTAGGSLNVNQTNLNTRTILVDSDNTLLDIDHYEEFRALDVVPGHPQIFSASLQRSNIVAATQLMVIDSDNQSGAWPHPGVVPGEAVEIRYIWIQVHPDNSFVGDVILGFLSNVDATAGDFNCLYTWHVERAKTSIVEFYDQSWNPVRCSAEYHLGPITADDTDFEGDVAIGAPDGNSYLPANNDIVLDITRTGGALDVSIMIGYIMHGHT